MGCIMGLQVKLLEFHPVQPWICYADTTDRVRVWDWTTQQVGCAGKAVQTCFAEHQDTSALQRG
jgi:hypothetical protein